MDGTQTSVTLAFLLCTVRAELVGLPRLQLCCGFSGLWFEDSFLDIDEGQFSKMH